MARKVRIIWHKKQQVNNEDIKFAYKVGADCFDKDCVGKIGPKGDPCCLSDNDC